MPSTTLVRLYIDEKPDHERVNDILLQLLEDEELTSTGASIAKAAKGSLRRFEKFKSRNVKPS